MEQVNICPHLGQNARLPIHIHIKPQKKPLKLSCHNKLLIQWNKAVVPMWKQLVLLRTQVEMVLFLLGKMILFNISVRSMHKVQVQQTITLVA